MSSIFEKIDNHLETFLSTLKRFPLASFSAFLFTIIVATLIDYHNYNNPNAMMASKVAFVSTLGILLFPALQLLGRSLFFPLLGLLLLGAYYYLLPTNLRHMGFELGLRHTLLLIALFLMLFWSPFIFRKSDNQTFWQYAQSIIFGLLTAIFFAAIVYGGLAAALLAIERLFNFEIRSVRYGQLAFVVFGIFGVNFFLAQIPKHPLFMQVRPYSKAKRIFSKNILAPIAIIFFIILYAYTAKILLSMSFPTGMLAWIIVAFSFVAIVSFLFLTPYLKKSTLPQRLIWLAIFLQTIMLGLALWMRVEEYGITYNRYLLGLFGLWLVLMSLYFILFGKAQQKWLFFFATLFILISQFGEYSAKNVTQKSQTQRLIQLIQNAHPRSEELEMKKRYEISDAIAYIHRYYGIDAFEKITPHILKKYKEQTKKEQKLPYPTYDFPSFATKELGFAFVNKWQWFEHQRNRGKQRESNHYFYTNTLQKAIKIENYSYLIDFYHNEYALKAPTFPKALQQPNDLNLTIGFKDNQLTITKDANLTSRFDLTAFAVKLLEENPSLHNDLKVLPSYEATENGMGIKILFRDLSMTNSGNIRTFSSQILFKSKEN